MQSSAAPLVIALTAAACVGIACAADPGDPDKSTSPIVGNSSSSSSSSGFIGGSSSSGSTNTGSSSSGVSGSSSSGSSSGFGSNSSSSSGVSGSSSSGSGSSSGGVVSSTCIAKPSAAAPTLSYETTDSATMFPSSQQMGFNLNLTGGLASTNMSDITIRYWFYSDMNDIPSLFFVSYYSQVNNTAITADISATFSVAPPANVTPMSDAYMQLSFSAAAPALAFGTTANIQVVVHGPGSGGYSDRFNETNDYSFNATETAYGLNNNITYYVKGVLVGGCEPGAGGGATSSSSSSSSSSSGGSVDSGTGSDANASGATDATTE